MSPRQHKVLLAWRDVGGDFGYLPFGHVAANSHVPLKFIRRAVRALARAGYLQYAKGLWTSSDRPGGAGYGLTKKGEEYLEEVEEAEWMLRAPGIRIARERINSAHPTQEPHP